jgi:hypothetical protein
MEILSFQTLDPFRFAEKSSALLTRENAGTTCDELVEWMVEDASLGRLDR